MRCVMRALDESPVNGNPTGMARTLGAEASLALRRRLSTALPLSRAPGPSIAPLGDGAVGDRQQRAIPSYRGGQRLRSAYHDRRWRADVRNLTNNSLRVNGQRDSVARNL
jgi:hypothetical protein